MGRTERLVTVNEAASLLGLRERTVRAMLAEQRLPRVRVGVRAVRIPLAAIESFVAERTIPARRA
jgi:excisionase family DNA binding protein